MPPDAARRRWTAALLPALLCMPTGLAGLAAALAPPPPVAEAPAATAALRDALAVAAAGSRLHTIVTFHEDAVPAGRERLRALDAEARDLRHLPVSAAVLRPDAVREIARWPEVRRVNLDLPLRLALNRSAHAIAAPEVWEALGETGRNATAMIIDTGVDAIHADLRGRVVGAMRLGGWGPLPGTEASPPLTDLDGHGTHVAGILAGNGEALGPGVPGLHRRYAGVAPGARLVAFGMGTAGRVLHALEGFDYALEHHAELGIRVLSNSWELVGGGVHGGFDPEGEVEQAALKAYRAGIAVVFAAGNQGPEPNTMSPLAMPPWVLGVAAATSHRALAAFSSRGVDTGPHASWSHPDLAAPGTGVMSARSASSNSPFLGPAWCPDDEDLLEKELVLAEQSPQRLQAEALYQCASGTSMAAPHVAGVLALMVSANPTLSPDQLYDLVVASADPLPYAYWEAGAGFLNASRAVQRARETRGALAEFLAGQRAYEGSFGGSCDRDDALARLLHQQGKAAAPCSGDGNAPPDRPFAFPTVPGCPALAFLGGPDGIPVPLPGLQHALVGGPFSVGVWSLDDFEGEDVRLRVAWGDGAAAWGAWRTPGESDCLTHTYAAGGAYEVLVRVVDARGRASPSAALALHVLPPAT